MGEHSNTLTIDSTASPADTSASVFAQAYNDLRNLILAGEFELNHRLTEAELTRRLDVSRGTVRAVTARLAQEGYLTSEPHRGVRTREFTIDEAMEILETREVLEAALAGLAAERASDEQLAELGKTLEMMAIAEREHAASDYSGLNRHFHQQVREAADQATMTAFVDSLHYPLVMRQYRDQTTLHPRRNSLNEHLAILYALQTRNAEAASAAMRHHVESARRALLLSTRPR